MINNSTKTPHLLFNALFEEVKNISEISISKDSNKYFREEMFSFYSISNGIMSFYSDNVNKTYEYKQMNYPAIRRLLESCFRILYIFEDENKIDDRYKCYLEHIKNQYNTMLSDMEKAKYLHAVDYEEQINKLPERMENLEIEGTEEKDIKIFKTSYPC